MTVAFGVSFEKAEPEHQFELQSMSDAEVEKEAAFRFDAPGFPGDDDFVPPIDEPVIPTPEPFEFHELRDERGRSLRTPAEIELEADDVRTHLAMRPQKSQQVVTPDEILTDLEWAKHLAGKSAQIIRDADRTLRALQRLYAARFSIVVKQSKAKSSDERRMETDLILAGLVAARDDAEVVFEYAKRVAKSVEGSTSAIQTQASMVRVTYAIAGTGRE